jgi:hypothetical protein
MDTRKLRIVRPPLPAIGICECCKAQFKSGERSQEPAENEIKAALDAHECNPIETSLDGSEDDM